MLKSLDEIHSCRIFHSTNYEEVQNLVNIYIEDRLIEIIDVKFTICYDGYGTHFSAMVIFKI
jgi:hypothetical protein